MIEHNGYCCDYCRNLIGADWDMELDPYAETKKEAIKNARCKYCNKYGYIRKLTYKEIEFYKNYEKVQNYK